MELSEVCSGDVFEGVVKLVGETEEVPETISEFGGKLFFVVLELLFSISLGWDVSIELLPFVGKLSGFPEEAEDGVIDSGRVSAPMGGIDSGSGSCGVILTKGEGVVVVCVNGRSSLGESGSWGIGIEVSV